MGSKGKNIVETEAEESESSCVYFSKTIAAHVTQSPPLPSFPYSSANMSSTDIIIPGFNPFTNLTILKKGNFHKWKGKVIIALSAARLGRFIITNITPPTEPTKLEEYTIRNFQALSIIHKSVDDKHFKLVADSRMAWSAYLAIFAKYENSGGLSTATSSWPGISTLLGQRKPIQAPSPVLYTPQWAYQQHERYTRPQNLWGVHSHPSIEISHDEILGDCLDNIEQFWIHQTVQNLHHPGNGINKLEAIYQHHQHCPFCLWPIDKGKIKQSEVNR